MAARFFPRFDQAINNATVSVLEGQEVDAGRWQGIPTEGKPDLVTLEVLNWGCEVPVNRVPNTYPSPAVLTRLAHEIQPNVEWADEHFEERVGGEPLNPDPSHERWPHWHGQDSTTKVGGEFSHTYSERFWPKKAGLGHGRHMSPAQENEGIRYKWGDLNDVVEMLNKDPQTRQAYLPIFFPEDTGAVHGGRIPCTLGYHFLLRRNQLHMWYDIRSCDLYRHFRDDIYLAVRLQLWMLERMRTYGNPQWISATPGNFYFQVHSLHLHKGDQHHVQGRSIPGYGRNLGPARDV